MDSRSLFPVLLIVLGLATILAQSPSGSDAPGGVCEEKNGTSCEECLKNVSYSAPVIHVNGLNKMLQPPLDTSVQCLWCLKTKLCITYPVRTILPPHSVCPLNDARWGLCWMNFQTLIIILAVLGAILIIAFLVCLFCCCKCENFGAKRFEAKMQKHANKTKTKQEERRAEMKQRHEEIRSKYGLKGPNPYSKF